MPHVFLAIEDSSAFGSAVTAVRRYSGPAEDFLPPRGSLNASSANASSSSSSSAAAAADTAISSKKSPRAPHSSAGSDTSNTSNASNVRSTSGTGSDGSSFVFEPVPAATLALRGLAQKAQRSPLVHNFKRLQGSVSSMLPLYFPQNVRTGAAAVATAVNTATTTKASAAEGKTAVSAGRDGEPSSEARSKSPAGGATVRSLARSAPVNAVSRQHGATRTAAVRADDSARRRQHAALYNEYNMPRVPRQHDDESTIRPDDAVPVLRKASSLSSASQLTVSDSRSTHREGSPDFFDESRAGLTPTELHSAIAEELNWNARRSHIIERNRVPSNMFGKPRCRFGDACRRENPQHFEQKAHPVTHPRVQLWDEWCVVDGDELFGDGQEAKRAAEFETKFEVQRSLLEQRQKGQRGRRRHTSEQPPDLPPKPNSRRERSRLSGNNALLDPSISTSTLLSDDTSGDPLSDSVDDRSTDRPSSPDRGSDAGLLLHTAVSSAPRTGYASEDIFAIAEAEHEKQEASARLSDSQARPHATQMSAVEFQAAKSSYSAASCPAPAPIAIRDGYSYGYKTNLPAIGTVAHNSTEVDQKLVEQTLNSLSAEELRAALLQIVGQTISQAKAGSDQQLKMADFLSSLRRVLSGDASPQHSLSIPKASLFTPSILESPPSSKPGVADGTDYWNREFLNFTNGIRMLGPNTRHADRTERYSELAAHGQDFIDVAKTYGAILISEVGLDDSLKTIPPLKGKGFAGGDKYFVHGIYFKLAVDTHECYGGSIPSAELFSGPSLDPEVSNRMDGDERAMRVAGHELRHIISVFNCWSNDAAVAMCVCLDFRGFRMLAMSALPITDQTLRYGCSDAAKGDKMHVHTGDGDDDVKKTMRELSTRLNLKHHEITAAEPGPDGRHPTLFAPVDVEGHRGTDNKIYLVDLSRLFPPTDPALAKTSSPDPRSDFLVYLFRPEFVVTYTERLNPDAFSPFCSSAEDRDAIRRASRYLLDTVVPQFVRQLHTVGQSSEAMMHSYPLVQMLHVHGINLRYMGYVRTLLADKTVVGPSDVIIAHWRLKLIHEMLARTVKQLVRKQLRDVTRMLRSQGDMYHNPWKKHVIDMFICIFGAVTTVGHPADGERVVPANTERIVRMWDIITAELMRRFPHALSEAEVQWISLRKTQVDGGAALRDLIVRYSPRRVTIVDDMDASDNDNGSSRRYKKSSDARCVLFASLCEQLGLVFTSQSYCMATCNPRIFEYQRPFEETDLVEFVQRAKHLNIVAHAQGFLLRTKAIKKRARDEAQRLFDNAIEQFQMALHSDPSNKQSLRNLAECYAHVGRLDEANFCFQAALNSDNVDTNTLFKYATFLDATGRCDDAEELYLQALEAHPYHSNCLVAYADFLACERKNLLAAVSLYEAAISCDPLSPYANNNLACVLFVCGHQDFASLQRARELFRRSTEEYDVRSPVSEELESRSRAAEIDTHPQIFLRNLAIFLESVATKLGKDTRKEAEAAKSKYRSLDSELKSISYAESASSGRDSLIGTPGDE